MPSSQSAVPCVDLNESTVAFADGHRARIVAHRHSAPGRSQWVLLEGLLTGHECDELIELSRGTLQAARVVDAVTRRQSFTAARIGAIGRLFGAEHRAIKRLEYRIETLTHWPSACFQPLQVTHYEAGDEFKPHHDFFDPELPSYRTALSSKGQRLATLIVYLNDCPAAGATVFPLLDGSFVTPQRGNALFFSYHGEDGNPDRSFLHGSTPVTAGEKWIATTWLCERPQQRDRLLLK